MSADIEVLLKAQYDIHERMSRSVDNLRKMGVSNITRDAIQIRITILDNLWSKLEAQHELVRSTLKDKYKESEYAKSDFIDVAENIYVMQRSTLTVYAEKLKDEALTASKSEPGPEQAPRTSLPRIKLQTFSGAYEDWPAFRDLLLSIIDDNSISAVKKLHYLRSCLQGSVERLIRPLLVTGDTYERAWTLPSKHYENKRELIRSNFAAFTAVPRMKAETADELSRIFNAVTTAVNAQESIDSPIASHGMDLFNHLVVELFDPQTRLEWESSTCDSIDPPSHDTLMDFISKRILTLNAAKPRSAAKSEDAARPAKSHFARNTSDSSKCVMCKGEHSLMQCSQFKAKSASDRKSFVEANRLCFNCLGTHFMAQCQSVKICALCQSRHHTLLHDAYHASSSDEVSSLSAVLPKFDRKASSSPPIVDHRGRPQAAGTCNNIVQTTCGGKSSKNETKTPKRQNLPKIIANCVLPKGIKKLKGVKIEKLRINNSLQSNIPTQIFLEQDVITRCNNDKSIAQTFCNDTTETITTTENIREKKHHTSHEINESFDTLKLSSPLNNNVGLKDKDLSNNKSHSKVIDYTNLNSATKVRNNGDIGINNIGSEIITTHENYTLSNQEQLNRFINNTEVHENNILQDNRKCEEKCTKNILNKNVSDLMDIDDENYNINTSSILASKEGNILPKETLKRTLKEKDCNQGSKKMKLNRNSWLQSNVAFKSSNYQQDNDSLSSVTTNTTVETNKTKKYNQEERSDLRKYLNQMRLEKSFKLKPTVEIANEKVCKKLSVKEESTLNGTLYEKKSAQQKHSSSVASDDEDDDCISLFAEPFAEFDTSQCEDISLNEKDKSSKSLHCDVPYTMTASSFDKYVKENNKEFNKEYAKCIENDTESLKSDKTNEIFNHKSTQVLNTDCVLATATQSKSPQTKNVYSKKKTLYDFGIKGYCYQVLKYGTYYKRRCQCKFKHNIKKVFQIINSEDSRTILDIMPEALKQNFNYFCEEVYIALLKRLNTDEILKTYKMLYDNWNVNWRKEFTKRSREKIASNIIEELLNRQMSLEMIVDYMMTHILPTKNLKELNNILLTVKKYVKSGEYWNTTKKFILTLQSNVSKCIIDEILNECIKSKELQKIQDVNSNLISKLDFTLISTLDECVIMKCFKSMLVEKTAKNSKVLTQNFGDSLITTETIASPDSPDPSQNINFTQQEPPIKYDVSSINETDVNKNRITQDVNVPKPYVYDNHTYFMQPIDAPYARSIYREHERFWKFYMDLERFEKGLIHEDYNYVIDILKSYTEKRESELFVSKCYLIFRNIKRSEYHLKNILTLTGNQYFNKDTLIERGYIT